jgi:uncharacterized protein (TIGR03086 family)
MKSLSNRVVAEVPRRNAATPPEEEFVEIFEAFDRAIASTAGVVKGVHAEQMSAPTPCTAWTVQALLNHVLGTLWLIEGLLGDRAPRHALAPGGLPAADLHGGDPATAYAEASAAALTAASAGDALVRVHATPLGEMPGPVLAGFTTLDIFVHGWDLAKATGQSTDLDPGLAAHVLAFAQQTITDDTRAPRIGPAVPAATHAPAIERLVAFLGRQP